MKLTREKQLRPQNTLAKEVLGTETERSPMADFERLFTPERRRHLESKFVELVEEEELFSRHFIEAELSGLLVLDQVLTVPLVTPEVRQRAKAICQAAIGDHIKQVEDEVAVHLDPRLLERLSSIRRLFPELAGRAALSNEEVANILQRSKDSQRPSKFGFAQMLFSALILNPGQQPAIKSAAWSVGFDDYWKSNRVEAGDLNPCVVHRLLEPTTQLTPVQRAKWIAHYLEVNQDPNLQNLLGLNIRGYAMLAILLAPDPRVLPNGQIDLGMPARKVGSSPDLPPRIQV